MLEDPSEQEWRTSDPPLVCICKNSHPAQREPRLPGTEVGHDRRGLLVLTYKYALKKKTVTVHEKMYLLAVSLNLFVFPLLPRLVLELDGVDGQR